jgi:hypothetical protein
MRGHSTVHQLIEIYHNICLSLENREVMCTVFCDISKAFDKVWHVMYHQQTIAKDFEYLQ